MTLRRPVALCALTVLLAATAATPSATPGVHLSNRSAGPMPAFETQLPVDAVSVPADPTAGWAPVISGPISYVGTGGHVYSVIKHMPVQKSVSFSPAVVGQNSCSTGTFLGQHGGSNAYYIGTNIDGVGGVVENIANLYPCTGSGGILPSDTWVLPANLEGPSLPADIQQLQYGAWDGGGLRYEVTMSDNGGGAWATWPDSSFLPIAGDEVFFGLYLIYPGSFKWHNYIYDYNTGIEETLDTPATWFQGNHAWWGYETDNSNSVLGVPGGPPYIDLFTWSYRTTPSETWNFVSNLPFSLWRPDWKFYHGGLVNEAHTHDTVVAWTTAH